MIALIEQTCLNVACVDDNPDVLELLHLIVKRQPGMKCIGIFTSANSLLEFLHVHSKRQLPDIVLMDWSMPGMKSETAISTIGRLWPDIRVLVYTAFDVDEIRDVALEAGACGVVRKTRDSHFVIDAIRRIAHGEMVTG